MGKPFLVSYSAFIFAFGLLTAVGTVLVPFLFELRGMLLWCFVFFGLLTPVLHFIVFKNNPSPASFVRKFLLVTTLKFFLFALIAVSATIAVPNYAKNFLLSFLFNYLPFTAFETIMQYKVSKIKGKN